MIHPTYVDTFGLVVLEALAHGLGIISTDLYALPEMVYDGVNGIVINPPISIWDGYLPSKYYKNLSNIKETINSIDTFSFEKELENRILGVIPHSILVSNDPINDYKFLIDEVKYNKEIIDASPYISIQGLITSSYNSSGITLIGIDPAKEKSMSIIPEYM